MSSSSFPSLFLHIIILSSFVLISFCFIFFFKFNKHTTTGGLFFFFFSNLSFSQDIFEMQDDSIKPGQNVIVIDDLIATGGSAAGAQELIQKLQGNVLEFIFLIELEFLKGKDVLKAPVYSMIKA